MKNYVSPKMDLVVFNIIDVITTSGIVMLNDDNELPLEWIFP